MDDLKQVFFEETNEKNTYHIWEKISNFIRHNLGGWFVIDIYLRIKNIFRWLPIIWKDKDWDQSYIYKILKFKLENQSKYIIKNNRYTLSQRDAEIINICVNLIDKVNVDFYSNEYLDYIDSEIYFAPIDDESGNSTMEEKINSESFDDYFIKYKATYNKILNDKKYQIFDLDLDDISDIDKKQRIAMNISLYNQNKARKMLFRLMEENIERWWD